MASKRKKRMVTITVEPALIARIEAWISAQEHPIPKNYVWSKAVESWLDAKEQG